MIWQIAARNLCRNSRRSAMTMLAIGVSGLAMLLFGGFVTSIWFGLQTSMVQDQGHIHVYKKGYTDYGAAGPDAYTIDGVTALTRLILEAPQLRTRIAVITPQINFGGIAGNQQDDNSKTFIGKGVVPSDYNRMRGWDGWRLGTGQPEVALADRDLEGAIVGVGMARMIGLCDELRLRGCQDPPKKPVPGDPATADFSDLVGPEVTLASAALDAVPDARPRLDLLAASSGGAPNIVSVMVGGAMAQATRAVDSAMVMLHYEQARRLLYADQDRATALIVQAHDAASVPALKADLASHLEASGAELEVLAFNEVDPTFDRVFGMFSVIFAAIAIVLGIVVVFTIANTVTMNVMERINEVGTIRAMGMRRLMVFRQFLTESLLLGLAGAALAAALGIGASLLLNGAGLEWTPPSNASPLAIQLMVVENPLLILGTALFLAALTVLASILPALRAVRIPIVKALHHA